MRDPDAQNGAELSLRLVKWLTVVLVAVQLGLSSGCSESAPEGSTSPSHPAAKEDITLSLKWGDESATPRLIIDLKNIGQHSILVDKELVFCVYIRPLNAAGDGLVLRRVGDLEVASIETEQLQQRLVTLAPGESLTREVDLEGGFKVFETAVASSSEGGHSAVSAFEGMFALPPEKEVATIEIWYEQPSTFADGFAQYTGRPFSHARLYAGRASSRIEYASRKRQSTDAAPAIKVD